MGQVLSNFKPYQQLVGVFPGPGCPEPGTYSNDICVCNRTDGLTIIAQVVRSNQIFFKPKVHRVGPDRHVRFRVRRKESSGNNPGPVFQVNAFALFDKLCESWFPVKPGDVCALGDGSAAPQDDKWTENDPYKKVPTEGARPEDPYRFWRLPGTEQQPQPPQAQQQQLQQPPTQSEGGSGWRPDRSQLPPPPPPPVDGKKDVDELLENMERMERQLQQRREEIRRQMQTGGTASGGPPAQPEAPAAPAAPAPRRSR